MDILIWLCLICSPFIIIFIYCLVTKPVKFTYGHRAEVTYYIDGIEASGFTLGLTKQEIESTNIVGQIYPSLTNNFKYRVLSVRFRFQQFNIDHWTIELTRVEQ